MPACLLTGRVLSSGENGGKKQAFHVVVPSLPGTPASLNI